MMVDREALCGERATAVANSSAASGAQEAVESEKWAAASDVRPPGGEVRVSVVLITITPGATLMPPNCTAVTLGNAALRKALMVALMVPLKSTLFLPLSVSAAKTSTSDSATETPLAAAPVALATPVGIQYDALLSELALLPLKVIGRLTASALVTSGPVETAKESEAPAATRQPTRSPFCEVETRLEAMVDLTNCSRLWLVFTGGSVKRMGDGESLTTNGTVALPLTVLREKRVDPVVEKSGGAERLGGVKGSKVRDWNTATTAFDGGSALAGSV
jgi:hypothetical protein